MSYKNEKIQMIAPRWQFNLSAADTRLVLAALGGRLRPDQEADAKRLGDELTIARANWANQFADEMDNHASKVES
jgi:hypothetical protein